jgi:hypothetical protein
MSGKKPTTKPKGRAQNTLTLPGNTTKSDVVHLLRMAITSIQSPGSVSPSSTTGLLLALESLASGVT